MIRWEFLPIIQRERTVAISMDLETMGLNLDGCLTEIGAVVTDISTDTILDTFHTYVDIVDAVAAGGKIYPDTVAWWARLGYKQKGEGVPVASALTQFAVFLDKWRGRSIYSKHILFDMGILERLYILRGLAIPWSYNQPQDLSTLEQLFAKGSLYAGDSDHNALNDARRQASALHQVYKAFYELGDR